MTSQMTRFLSMLFNDLLLYRGAFTALRN